MLPADLLQLSPEEAARRIALARLQEARAAASRLDDPDDPEALHDFRVAVRRLRSTLRAWKSQLRGSISKKQRRALRALQSATGGGRDAEVALAWLAGQRGDLGSTHRRGHDWLADRLERRREEAMSEARGRVRDAFERLDGALRDGLETMTVEVHLLASNEGEHFGEAVAAKAREGARDLAELLSGIETAEDEERCHRARIAGKRLRYLLEPLASHVEGTSRVVKRCKRLQDVLGDLHDAHVLRDELGSALEQAAVEQARLLHDLARDEDSERLRRATRRGTRPGLLELTRRVNVRARALFEELEKDWLGDGSYRLRERVEELAVRLEAGSRTGAGTERTVLLRGLPSLPAGAQSLEIEQGWLPGVRLRERVWRVRSGAEERHFRAVEVGEGARRIEIEEPTTPEMFEALWRLTRRCRVRKRCYRLEAEGRVWEIDDLLDRPLVLARVEVGRAADPPLPPDWLAPFVVRDVTDDPRYASRSLAESPGSAPDEDPDTD